MINLILTFIIGYKKVVKVSKNNKKYLIINSNNAIKENEKIILKKLNF